MWGLTPAEWASFFWLIVVLVGIEGLLSADNALVLAVMVRHLPGKERTRALRYGIWGAFGFRFLAVIFATQLLHYWQFEVVGGLYLLYLAVRHLAFGESDDDPEARAREGRSFWWTVVAVELADIAFSIDSILAAVGLADELPRQLHNKMILFFSVKNWGIYIGGVLGIIAMRFVAGGFIRVLDRFPGLATGAYFLVGWIGLKLIGEGLFHSLHNWVVPPGGGPGHWARKPDAWGRDLPAWVVEHLEMSPWVFWGGMLLIIALSLVFGRSKRIGPSASHDPRQHPESPNGSPRAHEPGREEIS